MTYVLGAVRKVGGKWFAYGATRVLGPYATEGQARRALVRENEEYD